MSTSLNDAVSEVYRELTRKLRESRLRRLRKNPFLVFRPVRKYVRCVLCEYGRSVLKGRSRLSPDAESFNVFEPTTKTFPETRIAVYTIITGGYDNLKMPVYVDDALDYYVVTDAERASVITQTGGGLHVLSVPENIAGFGSVKQQRYIKLHPDEVLSEDATGRKYDYTVYVDGSIRITCDIKPLVYSLIESGKSIAIHNHCSRDCIYDEAQACWILGRADAKSMTPQMNLYRSEGMPEHFGLFETPVIIRKSNDPQLQKIMNDWWLQIEQFSHRDQLSLPYVLWKNGLDMSYIFSLGNNVWENPYFLSYRHNN